MNQHRGKSLLKGDLRISVVSGLSVLRDFRNLSPCCLWEKVTDK